MYHCYSQGVVTKQQDMLAMLEEERLDREARKQGGLNPELQMKLNAIQGSSLLDMIITPRTDLGIGKRGGIDHDLPSADTLSKDLAVDVDKVMKDLEDAHLEVTSLMTQVARLQAEKQDLANRMDSVVGALQEHQRAIVYYEKQSDQHGLEKIKLTTWGVSFTAPTQGQGEDDGEGGHLHMGKAEEMQLQEVASTTIHSLKQLLEEKNRIIARYERKLSDAQTLNRKETAISKAEIDRLTEKLFRRNEDAISQLRKAVRGLGNSELGPEGAYLSQRLMEQLEEATSIIAGKDETVRQLELKLRTSNNQRERAEERCGAALGEQERMKNDLEVLARQLQDAEERVLDALKGRGGKTHQLVSKLQTEDRLVLHIYTYMYIRHS